MSPVYVAVGLVTSRMYTDIHWSWVCPRFPFTLMGFVHSASPMCQEENWSQKINTSVIIISTGCYNRSVYQYTLDTSDIVAFHNKLL